VYRQSPLGPVDPSVGALSGRLKFTVRRDKFNKDSLSRQLGTGDLEARQAPLPVQRLSGLVVTQVEPISSYTMY